VFVDLADSEMAALAERLKSRGILIRGPRWVVHLDVTAEDIEAIGEALRPG